MIMAKDGADSGVDREFDIGQLVTHRRYGYRGVIVAFDVRCKAGDEWYQSNQTQPDRNQPWYHVLVHDAQHTTYAAQQNLVNDPSGDPINHPWVERFFSWFQDGKYVRNETPWEFL